MVKAWKETVVIPTYGVGKPEKNPIFQERRVYQGSSGVVYPYPVIESVASGRFDKSYGAIYLENEYLKVMILPELGGRVQMAYDKIKGRHFIYYNSVVKPALVGLTGPWISGGIEINWPQHHRPSTFMPVDADIVPNEVGSVSVWVNERERMFHQKGMAGYTLRPGCAYLEVRGVVYNPTDVPQTFLWWANPAVKVNDSYQSVFPPDVNVVYDHGKRAVSTFPIATGVYYKMDYSAGVDISNYKNIKVPTSYMICDSRYDFEGGYENDTRGGMLHVANHHISPGKKQWTWGNGDFGWAWDRNLTDSDGPYIEVMAGVYAENQPDFSWLQPYEEKSFVQYFMPYREIGIVKNASRDLMLNLEKVSAGGTGAGSADAARVLVFATSRQDVLVELRSLSDGRVIYSRQAELSPENLLDETVPLEGCSFESVSIVLSKNGRRLLEWHFESNSSKPVPDPAKPALPPQEVKTCEQLYLTGLHLEQYRHATYNPVDYYDEALRRDPIDIRCNNALGLWYIRKGRFDLAEKYLRTAVDTLQDRNKNPYDGEPIYNLGLALRYQLRDDEAYDRFYKATWNGAWQDAGYFACAQISTMQGRCEDALDEIEHSLARNARNHRGRALKMSLLRMLGRREEALALMQESLKLDDFNYGVMYEGYLITGRQELLDRMSSLMHDDANDYDELALDYCGAGLYEQAMQIWQIAVKRGAVTPMSLYYLGWAMTEGHIDGAAEVFRRAGSVSADFGFPNRLEAILALRCAMKAVPGDYIPPYMLGYLYYDKRQYDLAVSLWEQSERLNGSFPTVKRNLALAYYNKRGAAAIAEEYICRAFELDPSDARVLMELELLYKITQHPLEERLALLEKYPALVSGRDDLVLERITLLNQLGRFQEAEKLIEGHVFHPWEGGEGKVSEQYQLSRVGMAVEAIRSGRFDEAVADLDECFDYPHNLGEGRLFNAQESDFYYLLGLAYKGRGDDADAVECWRKGVKAPSEPAAALYYNDAKPEKIFYSALCLMQLGRREEAVERFRKLLDYGRAHLDDEVMMDYFAVSLPEMLVWDADLTARNRVHCLFMKGLGLWGLAAAGACGTSADGTSLSASGGVSDCRASALRCLSEASASDINHLGIYSAKLIIGLL